MAISPDSRYNNSIVQTIDAPDGPRREMRIPFPISRQVSYTFYRVGAGDRVDTIADDFYGDARLWWIIADANPEILDWLDLQVGNIIRVPNA